MELLGPVLSDSRCGCFHGRIERVYARAIMFYVHHRWHVCRTNGVNRGSVYRER